MSKIMALDGTFRLIRENIDHSIFTKNLNVRPIELTCYSLILSDKQRNQVQLGRRSDP